MVPEKGIVIPCLIFEQVWKFSVKVVRRNLGQTCNSKEEVENYYKSNDSSSTVLENIIVFSGKLFVHKLYKADYNRQIIN